jgi:hypothetical protein
MRNVALTRGNGVAVGAGIAAGLDQDVRETFSRPPLLRRSEHGEQEMPNLPIIGLQQLGTAGV